MKFRKKPVVIEAIQWNGDFGAFRPWADMAGSLPFTVMEPYTEGSSMQIDTLEGKMTAGPKDWIVRGVKGEFYPVKPEIFEATYEPAERKSFWQRLGFHVHEWGKWDLYAVIERSRDAKQIGETMVRDCATCGDRQVKKLWMI